MRAWGFSRHDNTFIYLLDPRDELDHGDYFHMVRILFKEYISSRDAKETIIRDWTGLCQDPKAVRQLTFAIDKANNFYVGASEEIFVANLSKLE